MCGFSSIDASFNLHFTFGQPTCNSLYMEGNQYPGQTADRGLSNFADVGVNLCMGLVLHAVCETHLT